MIQRIQSKCGETEKKSESLSGRVVGKGLLDKELHQQRHSLRKPGRCHHVTDDPRRCFRWPGPSL